jgi:hypothetical protein
VCLFECALDGVRMRKAHSGHNPVKYHCRHNPVKYHCRHNGSAVEYGLAHGAAIITQWIEVTIVSACVGGGGTGARSGSGEMGCESITESHVHTIHMMSTEDRFCLCAWPNRSCRAFPASFRFRFIHHHPSQGQCQ